MDNLRLHPKKGLNARVMICPWCGADSGVALLGVHDKDKNGNVIPEYGKVLGRLCRHCAKKEQEMNAAVEAGGVFWRCDDCHSAGALLAHHDLAKAVREQYNIFAPKPVGISFTKADCPVCGPNKAIVEEKENKNKLNENGNIQIGEMEFKWYGKGDRGTLNYVRAFVELAWPAYVAQPTEVKELLHKVSVVGEFKQKKDLTLPWPSEEKVPAAEFKGLFQKLDPAILAEAAHVCHYVGDWFIKPQQGPLLEPKTLFIQTGLDVHGTGAGWRFANYADQILKKHYALVESGQRQSFSVDIRKGMLMFCRTFSDGGWDWKELGFATPENIEELKKHLCQALSIESIDLNFISCELTGDAYESISKRMQASRPLSELKWLDLDDYYF